MDQALIALYHRHIAAAIDRQQRLAEFLDQEARGEPWGYTISTATLEFGDAIRFLALDLGSHADADDSWLWSWTHPHLNLTTANRQLGEAVRELGRQAGIAAFRADRQVSCADLLGSDLAPLAAHVFATVVSGEFGFNAYYTMPFSHGRAAALIRDDRLRFQGPDPLARIVAVFPQVLAAFPVLDHHSAFTAYVVSYGLALEDAPDNVSVVVDGEPKLEAKFDSQRRLTELTGRFGPDR